MFSHGSFLSRVCYESCSSLSFYVAGTFSRSGARTYVLNLPCFMIWGMFMNRVKKTHVSLSEEQGIGLSADLYTAMFAYPREAA